MRQHFYGRENRAAFCGNTSTSMETLLHFAATLLRAWKPCCVLRQHFYGHGNLAAFCGRVSTIICSPPSFPFRPHQGVCDTPLQLAAKNLHETTPSITASPTKNGKYVGAYRIRPPHDRTRQAMESVHGKTKVCSPPSFPIRPHQGVCDTPLQFLAKYLHETTPSITASPTNKW